MSRIKTFSEFLNERELPNWSKPTSDVFDFKGKSGKGLEEYQNAKSRMGRFTPGENVKVLSEDEMIDGLKGKIISMEGMKITIRFDNMNELKPRGWEHPFDYEFLPKDVEKI